MHSIKVKTRRKCKVLALFIFSLIYVTHGLENGNGIACGINFPKSYNPNRKPRTIYMGFGTAAIGESLKDIDELKMNLKFEPPIIIAWTDEQITINQVSDFKDSQENKILDTECLQKIWSPTLMVFHRSKKSTYSKLLMASRYNLSEPVFNNVSHTNFILMVEESWDLWCKMDFSSYPVDKQVCYQNSIIINL